jgi:hypothetical protein
VLRRLLHLKPRRALKGKEPVRVAEVSFRKLGEIIVEADVVRLTRRTGTGIA